MCLLVMRMGATEPVIAIRLEGSIRLSLAVQEMDKRSDFSNDSSTLGRNQQFYH